MSVRHLLLPVFAMACEANDHLACAQEDGESDLCYVHERVSVPLAIETPVTIRTDMFNGDDYADILVTGTDAGEVVGRLLLADGGGGYRKPLSLRLDGCNPYVAVGDTNGDGRIDLLQSDCRGGLLLYRGMDEGRFAAAAQVAAAPSVWIITDVDGDGLGDVLGVGYEGGAPTLLLARSEGETFSEVIMTPLPVALLPGFKPEVVVGANVRRGGPFEVFLAEFLNHGAILHARYGGDGSFEPPSLLATDMSVLALNLVNLDGDEDLELLAGDPVAGEFRSFRPGNNEYMLAARTEIKVHLWGFYQLGHLDDDGWTDLAISGSSNVMLWLGRGDGGFDRGPVIEFSGQVDRVMITDVNKDQRGDIIVGTFDQRDPIKIALSKP